MDETEAKCFQNPKKRISMKKRTLIINYGLFELCKNIFSYLRKSLVTIKCSLTSFAIKTKWWVSVVGWYQGRMRRGCWLEEAGGEWVYTTVSPEMAAVLCYPYGVTITCVCDNSGSVYNCYPTNYKNKHTGHLNSNNGLQVIQAVQNQ